MRRHWKKTERRKGCQACDKEAGSQRTWLQKNQAALPKTQGAKQFLAVIGKSPGQKCVSTTEVRPLLCVNLQCVSNLKARSESVINCSLNSFDDCWCFRASCSFHSFPESLKGSETTTWITMIQVSSAPIFFFPVSRTQNAQNALPKLAFVLGSEFLG